MKARNGGLRVQNMYPSSCNRVELLFFLNIPRPYDFGMSLLFMSCIPEACRQ